MHNIVEPFNDQDAQSTFDPSEVESNKILVAICYIVPILFFLPIIMDKNSAFCKFHANQQLVLLGAELVIALLCGVLALIPIIGAIIGVLIGFAVLFVVICLVYGTWTGMALRIPVLGTIKIF